MDEKYIERFIIQSSITGLEAKILLASLLEQIEPYIKNPFNFAPEHYYMLLESLALQIKEFKVDEIYK